MKKCKILVVDGQGGKLGKQIVESIKARLPECGVLAVGTNAIATLAMQKGGADEIATGENAVICCAKKVRVIIGPIGIAVADSLMGEITPAMACAVGSSAAVKILIPINKCSNLIAGVKGIPVSRMIEDAIDLCEQALSEED